MNEPIKAGDRARVIAGLGRAKSPNIGKEVLVGHRIFGELGMDHTRFGPVHRCSGPGIVQLGEAGNYVEAGWADFPTAWLEKLPPETPPPEGVKTKEELTA